jgi:hypothetical protein
MDGCIDVPPVLAFADDAAGSLPPEAVPMPAAAPALAPRGAGDRGSRHAQYVPHVQ